MIKAVFFDIDGTVYDYESADEKAQQALRDYSFRELEIAPEELDGWIRKARKLADSRTGANCAATHNRLIRFQCLLELVKKPLFPHAYNMYDLYWNTMIEAAVLEPGTVELMRDLRKRGTYIGVGTNMTADIQYRKIEKLGIGRWIDGVVTSEEAGVEKPDVKVFWLCAEKAGAKPEECVFIGDSLEHDVKGAQAAGMHAVWYCPNGEVSDLPCPVIRNFSEYFETERSLI